MWRAGLSALLSQWRRHPGQAATLLLGLALATALWTGVQAINAEARASYDRAADVLNQNALAALVADDGGTVALTDYVALRRTGWHVTPVVEGTARLGGRRIDLIGVDPLTAPVLPAADAPDADPGPGGGLAAFIGPPGQLFAEPSTVDRLRDVPGLPTLVATQDLAPGTALGDIGIVAPLLDLPRGQLSRLLVLPDQPEGRAPLSQIAPALRTEPAETRAEIDGLTGSFHLNLTAFGLLSFAVGLFIVHGAIALAFEQRRPVIRTLRALGMPLRAVATLLVAELLTLALLAGLLGVALGYLIAAFLLPDVAATLRGLYGAPVAGSLSLRAEWILAGLAIAILGTAVASAQGLWRLIRLPALAPAQPRAWRRASETGLRRQAAVAVALLIAAPLIAWIGSGLVAGFAALGALLMGAALGLPPVLGGAIALAQGRARAPTAQWFWADTRQQLPGLSLALMALLLALAANIGVSTMVGSFRTAFTGWLDQRLAAEVYLNAGDPDRAAEMLPFLTARAEAVLPQAETEATLAGLPGSALLLVDAPTYRQDWPLITAAPDIWSRLAAGDGALVNEQLAQRAGLALGDGVTIDGQDLAVLGIYPDYGNPRAQAALGAAGFAALFDPPPHQRFALRLDPGDAEALVADIRAEFGLRPDQVIDQRALKSLSLEIFERTFAVTGALNVLTLGVAALAILTALLTLARLRLPQIAPVWALGLTRRRLAGLELARAGVLALLTALAALPVGLALAWMLLAIINVEAFGWRLPLHLFPSDWLALGALAILAALLAAAWPARRLLTRPPADLLRVFASER